MSSTRHNPWRTRLTIFLGMLLALAAAAHGAWAAPHQLPARQTVPTRTHTAAPTATATQTPDPTATYTPTQAPPTQQAPTQPAPTQPPPTSVPPTATSAPVATAAAPTATPSPARPAQLPVAGNDWGAALLRNGGLALAVLAIAGALGALTLARRSPREDRGR